MIYLYQYKRDPLEAKGGQSFDTADFALSQKRRSETKPSEMGEMNGWTSPTIVTFLMFSPTLDPKLCFPGPVGDTSWNPPPVVPHVSGPCKIFVGSLPDGC